MTEPGARFVRRCPETRADQADTVCVHVVPALHIGDRGFGILDLLETVDMVFFAIAVAATAHVEAQGYIAPVAECPRGPDATAAFLVTAKAVKDADGGARLPRFQVIGCMDDA